MEEVEDCRIVLIEGLKFDLTHSGHKPRLTFEHMRVALGHVGALGDPFGVTLGHFGFTLEHFGALLGPLWHHFGLTFGL